MKLLAIKQQILEFKTEEGRIKLIHIFEDYGIEYATSEIKK